MPLSTSDMPVATEDDILHVRHGVREALAGLRFGLVAQTKIITAASEIARNTLEHGGGGSASIEILSENGREGLRITFSDSGPGIEDVEQALVDGYTTGGGMGLGLSGAGRLVNELTVDSTPGSGTTVTLTGWA